MSSFSADWLALREPVDARARSTRLAQAVGDRLVRDRRLEILDLAAGTGSNTKYLSAHLRLGQNWLLVDRDETLLALARARLLRPAAGDRRSEGSGRSWERRKRVTTRVLDLSDTAAYGDLFAGRDLITASAFLDLISESWLRATLERCRDASAIVLFSLTYNGRTLYSPSEPDDAMIRDLVNQHQRTDKGFGAALGPDAPAAAVRLLEELGYRVLRESSDWKLTSADDELQLRLIEGWAEAAIAMAPTESATIERWREGRVRHLRAGRSEITVGHEDLVGLVRAPLTATLESSDGS